MGLFLIDIVSYRQSTATYEGPYKFIWKYLRLENIFVDNSFRLRCPARGKLLQCFFAGRFYPTHSIFIARLYLERKFVVSVLLKSAVIFLLRTRGTVRDFIMGNLFSLSMSIARARSFQGKVSNSDLICYTGWVGIYRQSLTIGSWWYQNQNYNIFIQCRL